MSIAHQELKQRRKALAKESHTTPGKIQKKCRLAETSDESDKDKADKEDDIPTPRKKLFQDL